MYKHILLPTDGSDRSERAIKAGIELAKALGSRVTGLFVTDPTYVAELDEGFNVDTNKPLAVVAQEAERAGIACNCVAIRGDTSQDGIVSFAKEKGCDLIVMGTRGRTRVGKFILGSAAASVLSECEIPVLLYR